MILKLTYTELTDILTKRFHIKPQIVFIDENTVEVKPAGIKVSVAECVNNRIVLEYQCNLISAMMISAIQSFFERKLPEGVEFKTSEKHIIVDLNKISKLKKVVENLLVNSLTADEQALNLSCSVVSE